MRYNGGMRRLAVVLLALLSSAAPAARADVVHVRDGEPVEGAVIGDDADEAGALVLVVLTRTGEVRLPRERVVRVEPGEVAADLRRRAERAATRLLERHEREATRLLRRWPRADEAERVALEAALDALPAAALLAPLEDAAGEGHADLRPFALERLAAAGAPAVDPLLRVAMTSRHADARDDANVAALALDAERARVVYEQVAGMNTRPIRRLRAIQRLEGLGRRASVPALVAVLEWARLELRAQLARARELRRVPVDLGTVGGAGVQVPIELPELELVEVATTVNVPVLRVLGAAATRALQSISGQAHGDDVDAWRAWWKSQPEAR